MARGLRFGVVGLGMGMHHCGAIVKAKGATLVGVCDHDEERLRKTVVEYDVKGYLRWKDMMNDPDIDAVCVCVESGKHADFGIDLARAGKHIIMEKPVDVTPSRIRKLEAAVKSAGVTCGCIFQSRLESCNILIKRAIDAGHMGRILGVHAGLPWLRLDEYYAGPHGSWKGTWKLDGGGSLMNQGIHTIDLIQWLAGRVERVFGYSTVLRHKIEAEDQTVVVLKFENGATGTLFTSTCVIPEGAQRVLMYGTKGSFSKHGGKLEFYEMGSEKQRKRMMALFGGEIKADAASKDPMAVSADGHMLIIEDLVKAVRDNRDPIISIASATHSVEIACAIYKASRTGRDVAVSSARA